MMKPSLLLLFFCTFVTCNAFGQSADETILKGIVEAETDAFTKMSMADMAGKYWLLDEKTMLNVTTFDGAHFQVRKDDMLQSNEVPPAGHATFLKTNYHFIINGDMASATYDQVVTLTDTGDKLPSRELHIFKKVDGVWKIHLSSVHQIGR